MSNTSTANDMTDLIQTATLATKGTDLFTGRMPDEESETNPPNKCVGVFETGAISDPKFNWDDVRITVMVRGNPKDYLVAYQLADNIKKLFEGAAQQTVNSNIYWKFITTNGVTFVHYDKNNRPIFTYNFTVSKEAAEGGNRQNI